jgi:transposase
VRRTPRIRIVFILFAQALPQPCQRPLSLLYLPPYSPDLNPIEQAFSKVKGLMRRAEAHTRQALIEAIGRALEAVRARDIQGLFEHCGYSSMGQLL